VIAADQARSKVLRFVGQNTFVGGQDFCFYYMFKNFLVGTRKIWGALSPNGYGPATNLEATYRSTKLSTNSFH